MSLSQFSNLKNHNKDTFILKTKRLGALWDNLPSPSPHSPSLFLRVCFLKGSDSLSSKPAALKGTGARRAVRPGRLPLEWCGVCLRCVCVSAAMKNIMSFQRPQMILRHRKMGG